MTEIVERNIDEIIELIIEAKERFDKTQVCSNSDRELRKYFDKIYELSDHHIHMQRFGNNTNIEVGNYNITAISDNTEDGLLLSTKYLEVMGWL